MNFYFYFSFFIFYFYPYLYFLFFIVFFYFYFLVCHRNNEETSTELKKIFNNATDTSSKIQELIIRSISETDINSLANSSIGDIVRSLFSIICFDSGGRIGMDIIPFLAEILKSSKDCDFDYNNNNNSNSNSNKNSSTYHDNDSTHSRKNVLDSKKNVLDYEVDIASNALLTALKNICNVHKIFRTVPSLIAKCNLCDTLSFMRGRLIQTRLKSVQNGILGQWMIL